VLPTSLTLKYHVTNRWRCVAENSKR